MMDDAISLAAVVAARAGWYPTDLHVGIHEVA
jgi:hypothetical protein